MSFLGKRDVGFALAGRVGVAKKYLECHEGLAEDVYNESGENEEICGYVTDPFCCLNSRHLFGFHSLWV